MRDTGIKNVPDNSEQIYTGFDYWKKEKLKKVICRNGAKDHLHQQCSIRCHPCPVVCKKICLIKNKSGLFEV